MKKGTGKPPVETSEASSLEEFSGLLSSVLNHPLCSVDMFNAITDELTEMLSVDWRSPEMILRALDDDARVRRAGTPIVDGGELEAIATEFDTRPRPAA